MLNATSEKWSLEEWPLSSSFGTVGKCRRSPLVGIDQHTWVLAHKQALAAAIAVAALALVLILGVVLIASVYV